MSDFPFLVTGATAAVYRRLATAVLFLAAVTFYVFVLHRAADYYHSRPQDPRVLELVVPDDNGDVFPLVDEEEYRLEKVLKNAATKENTVILTTLNEAWAAPNSVVDLFLQSFRIGDHTRWLLNHLVIVSLDRRAFQRCLMVHTHCFPLVTEGVDFSQEAYFMTPDYLEMMWRRIRFLGSILELGYNFVFSDADIMWFRNPFPHFYEDADFQIACDHFSGGSDDLDNSPNGGFKFVRSNNRTVDFYKFWYSARESYPGLHDQDVLNRIKNDSYIRDVGLKIRFLDTAYFGGFCEPSQDLTKVCTMHANCCIGLNSKLNDLKILLEDWKEFMSLPPGLKSVASSWGAPQNCSLESLSRFDQLEEQNNLSVGEST